MTGYPRASAAFSAASSDETIVPGGCLICSFCSSSYQRSRSSAASMLSGCVPQILTLPSPEAAGIGFALRYSASGVASFRGVCPPNWTMMPSGRHFSTTLRTSSTGVGGLEVEGEEGGRRRRKRSVSFFAFRVSSFFFFFFRGRFFFFPLQLFPLSPSLFPPYSPVSGSKYSLDDVS